MKMLIYCTKSKPYLSVEYQQPSMFEPIGSWNVFTANRENECGKIVNGKVVAECDFEVEEITYAPNPSAFERVYFSPKEWGYDYQDKYGNLSNEKLLKYSCLTNKELSDYLDTSANDKKTFCKDTFGYAIHIKNLHIFSEPKELCDYHISYYDKSCGFQREKHIWRAPQNMCTTLEGDIMISIRPEWVCKILNGEKTIEVRKKILNCMKGEI